ncbi:tetratricopeptide repeat protein [candidate division KSB1 bacterium]|nr:tetratricopeptide repeat protein [candidate division KSB1 bacterium]
MRENRNRAHFSSLPPQQQWHWGTQMLLQNLKTSPQALSAEDSLGLCNGIGLGYVKQSLADSAISYLQAALSLAKRLNDQEMVGTLYNNLGSANKLKKDWPQVRQWLEKSLSHNRALAGDSTAVLAYTIFIWPAWPKPKAKPISAASMRKRVWSWRSGTSAPRWRRF